MVKKKRLYLFTVFICCISSFPSVHAQNRPAQTPTQVSGQVLSLKLAVQTAMSNYGTIRAKSNYVKASQANVLEARREYLPDLSISTQQDYGTVNGQNGPTYGF